MSVFFSTEAGNATGSGDVDEFAFAYKNKFGSEPDASIIQQFQAAMAESGKALDDYGFEGDLNSRLSQKNALRDQLMQSQLDQYGLEKDSPMMGPSNFPQTPDVMVGGPAAQTNEQITQSPEYQDALQRFQDSQGQDAGAKATLDGFQSQMSANAGDQATISTGPAPSDNPYVSGVTSTQTTMDPVTQQLLYGLDGQGGFIPGAMRAANRTFFDAEGKPIVIPQEIAGFNQDQLAAMNLARSNTGSQLPFLQQSEAEMRAGLGALDRGQAQQLGSQGQSLRSLQSGAGQSDFQSRLGLGDALRGNRLNESISRGATSSFGRNLGGLDSLSRGAVDQFGNMIGGATGNLQRGVSDLGFGLDRSLGAEAGSFNNLRSGLSGASDTLGRAGTSLGQGLSQATGAMGSAASDLRSGQLGASNTLRQAGDVLGGGLSRAESALGSAGGRLGSGLSAATGALSNAEQRLGNELTAAIGAERGAVDRFGRESALATGSLAGSVDRFGNRLDDVERLGIGALSDFTDDLDESQQLLRGTTNQSFDPSSVSNFYNPYEDAVVQQTIDDATKNLSQADMQEFASNIARGGESAFGSRARLGASERAEAVGRGLAKEVGGIRAAGFQNAQTAAMNEFQRQQDAQRQGASGLASLSSQGLGASERFAGALGSGAGQRLGAEQSLSGQLSSDAAQRLQAERSIADRLSAAGSQRFGAGQSLASMMGNQASQEFGADQALAGMIGSNAAQRYGADQGLSSLMNSQANAALAADQATANMRANQATQQFGADQSLANMLGNQASQLGSAGQSLARRIGDVSQTNFGANQALTGQQMAQAQGMLGANQNMNTQLRNSASQNLAAQQQLGNTMANMGQASSNARNMYGQNTMANAQAVSQGQAQLGNVQNQIGQQQLQAQQGYGNFLQGLGGQISNANSQDMNTLMNMGNMQQGLSQQQLDAQRASLLQAQQAPLAQYQSLMPFMNMGVGAGGSSQINTNYAPTPSALQAGLATGLGTLGAVGNFVGQTSGNNQPSQYYYQ